jgi:hypothetical protein
MSKSASKQRARRTWSTDGHSLVPWKEVARKFNERTGEQITPGGAWDIGQRALRKLMKLADQLESNHD